MAGTLPGVESARRRRFHGCGGRSDSTMITSGYASTRRTSYESHLTSTSFLQRSMVNQSDQDENLGGAAREAKERLDGRLRRQWKSEIKRTNSQERSRGTNTNTNTIVEERRRPKVMGYLHTEEFGSKKSGSKRFSWAKMGWNWKALDLDECTVCLDQFKPDEKFSPACLCAH